MIHKKVALVSGTSSGIGLSIANLLSKNGYKVYGLSRRKAESSLFESVICDITDFLQVDNCLQQILSVEGQIDVLVNNAGRGISGAFEQIDQQNRRAEFELNYFALTNLCNKALPIMRQKGGGRIINISSLAAVFPIPYQSGYSASKYAVNGFSMALANEVRDFNIQVSVVMPGDTKTDFTKARVKVEDDDTYKKLNQSISKMERDEKNGMSSEKVAKTVLKLLKAKKQKAVVSVGFKNKFLVFLCKILPNRIMLFVVKKIYG